MLWRIKLIGGSDIAFIPSSFSSVFGIKSIIILSTLSILFSELAFFVVFIQEPLFVFADGNL